MKMTRQAFLEQLAGAPCFVGIDLSSKIDLAALSALFPPHGDRTRWCIDLSAWTPADTLDVRQHRDRAPYRVWVDQGWLETTPGNRIDYKVFVERMKELRDVYDIQGIGIDQWNAGNLIVDLENEGFQVVEVPQTFAHLSGASKDFEAEVLDGLVDANGNPLMRWAVGNAVVQRDGKDNIQPIKKKSRGRIDPVVATVIARRIAGNVEPASAYKGGAGLMVVGG